MTDAAITHDFVSAKSDGTDATKVQPSNWNALHLGAIPVINLLTDKDPMGNYYIPPSERAAMAAGTSTFDCLPALQAALAITTFTPGVTNPYSAAGPAIYFQPGYRFYFSDQVDVRRKVLLFGHDNSGNNGSENSWLFFAANKHGFVFHSTLSSGTTFQSAGSRLTGLTIDSDGSGTSGHGVWRRDHVTVDHCRIRYFGGNGVHNQCTAGSGGATEGNGNQAEVCFVDVTWCWGNGFFNSGADANAGCFHHNSAVACGLSGFRDDSAFGNCFGSTNHAATNCFRSQVHYLGNHYTVLSDVLGGSTTPGTDDTVWELCGTGGPSFIFPDWVSANDYQIGRPFLFSSANARGTVLVAPYQEGDDTTSQVMAPALVLNGFIALNVKSTCAHIYGTVYGFAGSRNGIGAFDPANANNYAVLGGDWNNRTLLYFTHATSWPSGWFLKDESGDLIGCYANSDSLRYYRMTGPTTGLDFGRSGAVSYAFQVDSLFYGSGNNARQLDTGTAAPVSGAWAQGDIRTNTGATAGQPAGWVCTVAGSPGTWAAFGHVDLGGSKTYDPPSIANGASQSTTVTATGAALGDFAAASFSLDLQGLALSAYVSAADTVTCVFSNATGGAIDLASGTLKVRVAK